MRGTQARTFRIQRDRCKYKPTNLACPQSSPSGRWPLIFCYNDDMKTSQNDSSASSYLGHVKNGVIVLDESAALKEGQAVRVEPLGQEIGAESASDRGDRVHQLEQLFAAWTEEDGKLSEDDADRLDAALEQSRGLRFRSPAID
jgi:hypothetical protein